MKTIEVTNYSDGKKITIFVDQISAIMEDCVVGCEIYAGSAFKSRFRVVESYKTVIVMIHKASQ